MVMLLLDVMTDNQYRLLSPNIKYFIYYFLDVAFLSYSSHY